MTLSDERLRVIDRQATAGTRNPAAINRQRSPQEQLTSARGIADLQRHLRVTQEAADSDRLEYAYAQCNLIIDAARRWRAAPPLAAALSLRCAVTRRLGRLRPSVDDAVAAGGLMTSLGADPRSGPVLQLLARHLLTLADIGDHAAGEALLQRAGLDELPDTRDGVLLRFARARLALAAGRPDAALPDLFRCGERLAAWGADRPTVLSWRSAAAAALWTSGAHESAARLAGAEVEMARRTGTVGVLGRALRVSGTVTAGPAGLAALEESVQLLTASPRILERAHSLVEHGARLNALRRRPQARRVLRLGLELAERCGSGSLVERAREQYTISGGRVRPLEPVGLSGLTSAELRAVTLAANGRTNRQIADELFLSVRTVEIHLTNAYQKVGVARRSELAAVLATAAPGE
ncbi:MAG TPA: LuxR C-terminal-related transcriptional regulator [Actinoplanes sp.]|nr:LuxR C-terminal-related transcriptional regulator [Actinoplanes sp.]